MTELALRKLGIEQKQDVTVPDKADAPAPD
jgi:hypothetical protein